MEYREFIEGKVIPIKKEGFTVGKADLHHSNKPHQVDTIRWALEGGRRAIFAKFGLGKTQMQLEMARLYVSQNPSAYGWQDKPVGRALIICPLGVKQEFKNDAKRLGISVEYCRNEDEIDASCADVIITNYERVRDGSICVKNFDFVSLDEAACLRSLGSKTYLEFSKLFENTPYKFVATATPSPNDYIELLNYAAFLGIMDVGQAKTRFFKRDSTKADELTLYPHKEKEFWLWVSSWALFLNKPSDLGYSDEGYDLPALRIHWKMLPSNVDLGIKDRGEQLKAFSDQARGLALEAKVKRETITERVAAAKEIIGDSEDNWIIWHHLEREREALEAAFPEITSVYGSQSDDLKEGLLDGFSKGLYKILGTKPEIAGSGCNFQKHCHKAIVLGINHKFNDLIQLIHRIYRYYQLHDCDIWILYSEQEQHIYEDIIQKWRDHDHLNEVMTELIKTFGLSHSGHEQLKRSITAPSAFQLGQFFKACEGDAVYHVKQWPDNSVGLHLSSWPFAKQFEYTPSYFDFGHNETNERFFEQMDYLIPEMYRTLKPGRISAVHVKDRIEFGNFTGLGFPTLYPFSDEVVKAMRKHGFEYMSRITIPTDVVRENKQTNRLGWTENGKDGTKMGAGVPEYLLLFRKPQTDRTRGYADEPVTKTKDEYKRSRWQIDAHDMWLKGPDRLLTPEEYAALPLKEAMKKLKVEIAGTPYNFARHCEIAEAMAEAGKLPTSFMAVEPFTLDENVWHITRMRGLNTSQGQRKDEKHLCPLPFDIVERAITRFSNPGDVVADTFAGIFTVPYCAIKLGRTGWGVELNPGYFKTGVQYCYDLEAKKNVLTLFNVA